MSTNENLQGPNAIARLGQIRLTIRSKVAQTIRAGNENIRKTLVTIRNIKDGGSPFELVVTCWDDSWSDDGEPDRLCWFGFESFELMLKSIWSTFKVIQRERMGNPKEWIERCFD